MTLTERRAEWILDRLKRHGKSMTHAELMDYAVHQIGDGWLYDGVWQLCQSPAQVYSGMTDALAGAREQGRVVVIKEQGSRWRYALPGMEQEGPQ